MADNKNDADKGVKDAAEQVKTVADQEAEQGFRGVEVDGTPNENYTVAGVIAGKPVPEAAADPVAARREASNI